ncbi:lipopolysaccharide kinase InaA family protein [Halomonas saccharevitans]|uniref:Lipopolysaccharide kinase (Kdo/WaaP) family protein n=1 Tax=Halomonas saccharevitans TaxID=416872 RepID=A0A1I7B3F3_9GAMM|nr:lipopolysaccharide kinase InaA family protein [Halomonas saccharevitans]SFT81644.1 Lipopolysaccharide kinase (Kdo/WaaP) family protein [Halomonas saccharevitans]
MKLLELPFDDGRHRYLVFHPAGLPYRLNLVSTATTQAFEAVGSSRFYVSQDRRILAKVVPDKFARRQAPFKWLLRDYLEKRCLGQSDARKEYLSLQVLRRAGLATPQCHGWGISLNTRNRNGSLLLMEHVQNARPGGEVFDELDEPGRLAFLERFCQEVARLAHAGYVHRDLHYNNLLIDEHEEILWIDAHVRQLPTKRADQWPALKRSLTAKKLRGNRYEAYAERCLHESYRGSFKG